MIPRPIRFIVAVVALIVIIAAAFLVPSDDDSDSADGEYNISFTGLSDELDYYPDSPKEGMTFATVWICAENTSGNSGLYTNPILWDLKTDGKTYDNHIATFYHPDCMNTTPIDAKGSSLTFPVIFEVPDGTVQIEIDYSGHFTLEWNDDMAVIIPS